jgi:hypothetical protein
VNEIPSEIYDALSASLTDKGIRQWWASRNALLHARPCDLWEFKPSQVLAAAHAFDEGVFV